VKRDFLSEYPYANFDNVFSTSGVHSRAAVPYQATYRGARPFFSDPLFKEQWYMVSVTFFKHLTQFYY